MCCLFAVCVNSGNILYCDVNMLMGGDVNANTLRLAGVIVEALKDTALRPFAIRAAADRWDELDPALLPLITASAAGSDDPRTKLELAVAIARFGKADHAQPVVAMLADEDQIVRHTAIQSLIKLKAGAACLDLLDRSDSAAPRAGALRALQGIHDASVVDGLIARLNKETIAERRRGMLVALCRLHFVEGI